MRAIIAAAMTLTCSIAIADDIQDAQRMAVVGRDSYWNCLGKEYLKVRDKKMSAQDFALYIGGVCPSERQNFRAMLVDYLTIEFPDVDAGTHMTTANDAIELAQKNVATTYLRNKAGQK